MSLNRLCVLFLIPTQFRYRSIQGFAELLGHAAHTGTQLDKSSAVLQRYCKTLHNSSMAFVSYYHQLAPAFYMASYAISSKFHFTLHHDYAYC